MSVGLLIISHGLIGAELVNIARSMIGDSPLSIELLPVGEKSDPDILLIDGQHLVSHLDQGQGVLILTDMYGSTPSNIANLLKAEGNIVVIAGINLPMLIRALNYPTLDLKGMSEKVLTGGTSGIFMCEN